MPPKKGKKGRRGDDSDEEERPVAAQREASNEGGGGAGGGKRAALKAKREARNKQQGRGGDDSDSGSDDPLSRILKKKGLLGGDDDDDEEEAPRAPAPKGRKSPATVPPPRPTADDDDDDDHPKGKKKGGKGGKAKMGVDDDDEDDGEIPLPSKSNKPFLLADEESDDDRKKKKKGGKKGKAPVVEEEEEVPPAPAPAPKPFLLADEDSDDDRRKKKGKKKGGKGGADEEEETAGGGGKKGKKGKKGKAAVDDDEEEDLPPRKGGKGFAAMEEDEDEEEEEEEPVVTKGKKGKASSKEKKDHKSKVVEDEEEEEVDEAADEDRPASPPPPPPVAMDIDSSSGKKKKEKSSSSKSKKGKGKGEEDEVADRLGKISLEDKAKPKATIPHFIPANLAQISATAAAPPPPPPEPEKKKKTKSKFAMMLGAESVAREEQEKKAKEERAALEAQLKAAEEEKARMEAAAKAQRDLNKKKAEEEDDDDDEEDDTTTTASLTQGTDGGSTAEPMVDKYMHDEGWVETMGGSLASEIAELRAKLADPMLGNKARKKLQKELDSKLREEEYNRAAIKSSAEGAQFSCSQTAVDENDPQWQNALDIKIPDFSISAHKKELFHSASLNIAHGRRYGLVGPNGMGKSTMLKMLASGQLKIPPRIDVLYVEQEVIADNTPAVEAVLKADKERWSLIERERQITALIDAGTGDEGALSMELADIYEQMSSIGADGAESKARRILFGLGFDPAMQDQPTKNFSGGWRMRISLARALFLEPTLLMLDEPTNHLDLNAVIWLDDYLQKWKKTLLVVSHDQDFLNSVCEEILHLDNKKIVQYRGNYDTFKELEEQRRKDQMKAWEEQEKAIRRAKQKGVTTAKAEQQATKSKSREPGARSKKKEKDAIATGQVATETRELIARPLEYRVQLSFAEVDNLNPPVIQVKNVSFRYGLNPWIFEKVDFGLDMESRVTIVGPNGSGKSTLVKLITGALEPTPRDDLKANEEQGMIIRNPRMRMGVYNQHFVDRLPMEETPVDYLRRLFQDETYQSVRDRLGRYGLQGHAHTIPMRDLSGGQKARVVFVELSLLQPHMLLLDEPTNNLDIETIDALIDAINEFNGGVVVVSHDARLILNTECQLWIVGEEKNVYEFRGGFEKYRDELLEEMEAQIRAEEERKELAQAAKRERLAAKGRVKKA